MTITPFRIDAQTGWAGTFQVDKSAIRLAMRNLVGSKRMAQTSVLSSPSAPAMIDPRALPQMITLPPAITSAPGLTSPRTVTFPYDTNRNPERKVL